MHVFDVTQVYRLAQSGTVIIPEVNIAVRGVIPTGGRGGASTQGAQCQDSRRDDSAHRGRHFGSKSKAPGLLSTADCDSGDSGVPCLAKHGQRAAPAASDVGHSAPDGDVLDERGGCFVRRRFQGGAASNGG